MTSHYYAFGSICRGEIDSGSDVDLLACVSMSNPSLDRRKFSIYKYERIRELWRDGNPFAWHLHYESRLIFSSDGSDFLADLGAPATYTNITQDCMKFRRLFFESYQSLLQSPNSAIFHLSCLFLATRNFATCYSFSRGRPVFSRRSPLVIDTKLPINENVFDILARARILSTRGYGNSMSMAEVEAARASAPIILDWMESLIPTGAEYE